MDRAEFLSHFLWRCEPDFSYLPPNDGALEQALAAAVDRIGFNAYQRQFDAFYALVVRTASEGLWGGERRKNPWLTDLANLPPEERRETRRRGHASTFVAARNSSVVTRPHAALPDRAHCRMLDDPPCWQIQGISSGATQRARPGICRFRQHGRQRNVGPFEGAGNSGIAR